MRIVVILFTLLLSAGALANSNQCSSWPLWDRFKKDFITEDGRVIDPIGQFTTSEGQSYAMFFALVANEPEYFYKLYNWTNNNLSFGQMEAQLPAWKWGQKESGDWGIIDINSATDSDMWITYALSEAARLWGSEQYKMLSLSMLQNIRRKETVNLPMLGQVLLPGPVGFYEKDKFARVNLSYLPLQLIRYFSSIGNEMFWKQVLVSTYRLNIAGSPHGFAPDWITLNAKTGFAKEKSDGSYEAIRVYLWHGMLSEADPLKDILIDHFSPMAEFIEQNSFVPEKINVSDKNNWGKGGSGFSLAVMPLLESLNKSSLIQVLEAREAESPVLGSDNYYNYVLAMYAQGWMENRYRFNGNGELLTNWKTKCDS